MFLPEMRDFNSRVQTSDAIIYWFLNGNRLDFTFNEYREMVLHIRRNGLFHFLQRERPALYESLNQIIDAYNANTSEPIEDGEREYTLEQMIFDLESKIF
jgi:hypothetical protein